MTETRFAVLRAIEQLNIEAIRRYMEFSGTGWIRNGELIVPSKEEIVNTLTGQVATYLKDFYRDTFEFFYGGFRVSRQTLKNGKVWIKVTYECQRGEVIYDPFAQSTEDVIEREEYEES